MTTPEINDAAELLEYLRKDRPLAFETLLRVENKEGRVVPFKPWHNQLKVLKYKRMCQESKGQWSLFIPKVRQGGITTACMGDNVIDSRLYDGRSSLYMIKSGEDCEPLFKKLRVMDENLPQDVAGAKRSDQIRTIHYKDTNSQIRITEAGNSERSAQKKGRGATTQYMHITEAAYIEYLPEIMQGAVGSVSPDGCIVYESTMNGPRGAFYQKCIDIRAYGEELEPNVWKHDKEICLFLPFYEHPEYFSEVPDDWKAINDMERDMLGAGVPKGAIQFRRERQNSFVDSSNTGLTAEISVKREYPWNMDEGFESTGSNFFTTKIIKAKMTMNDALNREMLTAGIEIGEGMKPMWVGANGHNTFKVWSLPKYDWENRYLTFMDCANGRPGGDYDCIYVYDRVDNLIVANSFGYHGAEVQCKLGINLAMMYDFSWLSWDNTGLGKDRLPYLLQSEYPNLFSTKQVDDYYEKSQWLGLTWNKSNRPQAIAVSKSMIEGGTMDIPDNDCYKEMLKFGYNEDGSGPEGQLGSHDDRVMTIAGIAFLNPYVPPPVPRSIKKEESAPSTLRRLLESGLKEPVREPITNW